MEFENANIAKMYNERIPVKYRAEYEYKRWFSTVQQWTDYQMLHEVILEHVSNRSFSACVEVGPGPGTWTRLLYRANPQATFLLIDIAEEMRRQFTLEMRCGVNVVYLVNDFAHANNITACDLFFSSRAVEYFAEKAAFFSKLKEVLLPGGTGIIITKNPDFIYTKHKTSRWQHSGQLSLTEMQKYLHDIGCEDISFYPAIIRVRLPFVGYSRWASKKLFSLAQNSALSVTPQTWHARWVHKHTESYVVTFKKS